MKITTKKHWQIFFSFIVLSLLTNIILDTTLGLLGYSPFDALARSINFLVTFPLYISYPYLIGQELNDLLKNQNKFKPTSNWSLTVLVFAIVIPNFLGYFYIESLGDNLEPPMWLLLVLMSINFSIFFKICSFGARPMKSIELKRTAGFWEYGEESFQFLFWPLGLWWIQPKVNEIVTREIIINE